MHARLLALSVTLAASVGMAGAVPVSEPHAMKHAPSAYWSESLSGGPPKDGIPSIDQPHWWSATEGNNFLHDDDRIIGIYRNGEARAYPQRILVWHEIVNDTIGNEAISVTYCPLTGTALGFLRGDNELGVSGRLVNSNLIMYDRRSDSYWPQILGAAIRGPHQGEGLEEVRVVWTRWENWRQRHPETRVLSDRTGYMRNYRHDPYGSYVPLGGYYKPETGRIFPVMHEDERYAPKQEVFGFRFQDDAVAVDKDHLRDSGVLVHDGTSARYLILHDPGLDTAWVFRGAVNTLPDPGQVRFERSGPQHPSLDTLQPVNGFEAMWFAWYAFYPQTVVLDDAP